ncbi:MAG: BamA/TamA family outer membrane protein [Rickettsiales bacterium]|nr:BamA/TamA family outer membrane protein [Pseudomonadota bacterium]MDA0965927.1 BamA/TamA family outer membrane protein [Pseudomonadota bacterium]MDG4542603.1 BamA/TamA family outer membrane protein [Rickettsiales bacterium]MDG4545107.1 BamA/TamA family outer membrane protein [Rickettsiales bacterium]MDG4547230.1 BamA/TamA family outer membrane protein [Rickettsiales bacterium]
MTIDKARNFIFITLFVVSMFAFQKATAIDLPLLGGKPKFNIEFSGNSYEGLLKPLIENVLKKNHFDRKNADFELSINKSARIDKEAIEKLLRSEGFYSAKIKYEIIEDEAYFNIEPDEPYLIKSASIESFLENLPSVEGMELKKGERFRAEGLLNAISSIKKHIEKHNCLWEISVDYDATINHSDKEAQIVINVEGSNVADFGYISFEGNNTIKESYMLPKIGFKEGGCFKRSEIEKARLNLFETGLISGVETTLQKNSDNSVDVKFDITERKHKTVKLGGGVSSDEGVILSAGWEHRNIFGKAWKLQSDAKISELYRTANTELFIPSFLSPKQTLNLSAEVSEENLEAFNSIGASISARLERKISKHLTGSIGSRLNITQVDEDGNGQEETFGLLSFPLAFTYDRRDNILDPKKGWSVNAEIAPFIDTFDTGTGFVKTTVGASAYHTFERAKFKPTFALRGAVGSINGQNTDDIPIAERFFAGGGGSVRGYAFQKLGPLDVDIPTGGRSFTEMSFESRLRFTPKWGGVMFLDAGNAYDDITPDLDEGVRWAYGAGVRYYTDFAPLRFDMAFPLERREGIDDSFQFYISIGQAF